MHKIAILSDIHGNVTALEAVLEDAFLENATDYWILGDLIMPGPGASDIIKQLRELPNVIFVKGNWDDFFLNVPISDFTNPTNVYGAKLAKHKLEALNEEDITFIKELPLTVTKEIAGLKFLLCHLLPDKNHGGELWPNEKQENFDLLFAEHSSDVAVYGHMHHQLLRYSSEGQLIINPGAVYLPCFTWEAHHFNLKPQYAMMEVTQQGIGNINFKKVDYEVEKEIVLAEERGLPYLNLYKDALKTGHSYTHHKEVLKKINDKYGYAEEVANFFNRK